MVSPSGPVQFMRAFFLSCELIREQSSSQGRGKGGYSPLQRVSIVSTGDADYKVAHRDKGNAEPYDFLHVIVT